MPTEPLTAQYFYELYQVLYKKYMPVDCSQMTTDEEQTRM